MQKYTNEQYNAIFEKLPEEIRDAVASADTTKHLWEIGQSHKLQIDQLGLVQDLSLDVMMGIIASKDFVKELQNELKIPALDASTLARDIDEQIFKPIKNIMIKLYGENAPNKPSSSLVQFYEEDESHPSLDKDTLLKEIENPAPAVVKVEQAKGPVPAPKSPTLQNTGLETSEEVRDLERMQKSVSSTPQKPVDIKKVETTKPAPVPVVSIVTSVSTPSSNISSTLEKLASMKLSKSFVMPKEGGLSPIALNMEPKPAPIAEDKSKLTAATTPPVIVAKPDATPYTPPSAKYPVDPYREPAV